MNYYNEFDSKTANWLKELIKQGLIPNRDVDTRSITEIKPHELNGYTQCHFFAGIGGWSLALQLANWDSTRHVWTGSCPCQPFSTAGKGLAQADERHLWPVFFNLIKECRPEYVFGEQVASAIGKGWLDGISTDLGEEGYTCGSAVLGAHSVGAPHIRQRLYWVAYCQHTGLQGWLPRREDTQREDQHRHARCGGAVSGVAQPDELRPQGHELLQSGLPSGSSEADRLADSGVVNAECSGLMGSPISNRESAEARREEEPNDNRVSSEGCAIASGMGNPIMSRCETCDSISGRDESRPEQSQDSSAWSNVGVADTELCGCECQPQQRSSSILPPMDEERESREPACPHSPSPHRPARPDDHWSNCTIIPCRDGKARRIPAQAIIEPVLQHVVDGFSCSLDARGNILSAAQGFPLAETIPGRVALLKGAGNAIVPQVAAEFIAASIEAIAT